MFIAGKGFPFLIVMHFESKVLCFCYVVKTYYFVFSEPHIVKITCVWCLCGPLGFFVNVLELILLLLGWSQLRVDRGDPISVSPKTARVDHLHVSVPKMTPSVCPGKQKEERRKLVLHIYWGCFLLSEKTQKYHNVPLQEEFLFGLSFWLTF